MTRSTGDHALVALTAAVEGHKAGGEVRTRLQSDWSDSLPTIFVRIGNHATVKQARTFDEAAEALLGWVGSLVVDDACERGLDSQVGRAQPPAPYVTSAPR